MCFHHFFFGLTNIRFIVEYEIEFDTQYLRSTHFLVTRVKSVLCELCMNNRVFFFFFYPDFFLTLAWQPIYIRPTMLQHNWQRTTDLNWFKVNKRNTKPKLFYEVNFLILIKRNEVNWRNNEDSKAKYSLEPHDYYSFCLQCV